MNALTPLAVQNGDLLRRIGDQPTGRAFSSVSALAREVGRDESNLRKTLKALESADLIATVGRSPFSAELTPSGAEARAALDRAEGLSEAAGELVRIAHHHLRPNPLNPRQEGSLGDLAGLADTIEAAGDVLQNLVVYPPDAEGVHVIAAGERRWRAVGLLVEDGRWPADRGLPCVLREHDEAQTDFVALVENGQRENLSMIEQARAYLRLTEAQGWSAREAALKTGRDPRTVQEMLKVLREAPAEAIGWCEQGRFTWEELRGLVRTPKAPDTPPARAEPEQRDIEEIAGPPPTWEEQRRTRIFAGCEALSPKALMVLVEAADKAAREPSREPIGDSRYCVIGEKRDYRKEGQDLIYTVGFGFAYGGGEPPQAVIGGPSIEWLREKGLHTPDGDRDAILRRVRMAAVGEIKTWAAEDAGRYVTQWLNVDEPAQAEATTPAERPGLVGDDFSRQLHEAVDEDASEAADKAAAAETLAKVRTGLATGCFGPGGQIAFRDLLEAAGMVGPIITGDGDNPGQLATREQYLGAIDTEGDHPDDLAIARAELIAFAVNAFAGYSIDAHRGDKAVS